MTRKKIWSMLRRMQRFKQTVKVCLQIFGHIQGNGKDVLASLIYHGPTSLYNGNILRSAASTTSNPQGTFPQSSRIDLHYSAISESFILFFRWQYHHFMFIHCDEFFLECLTDSSKGAMCSVALVYTISALGASVSLNLGVEQQAGTFYIAAQNFFLSQSLIISHITSAQALLCCAFYEVGNGNFSKGWLVSGKWDSYAPVDVY